MSEKKDNSSKYILGASAVPLAISAKSISDYKRNISDANKLNKSKNLLRAAGVSSVIAGQGAEIVREIDAANAIKKGKTVNQSLGNVLNRGPIIGNIGAIGAFSKSNNLGKKAKESLALAEKNKKLAKGSGAIGLGLAGTAYLSSLGRKKEACDIVDDVIEKTAARAWKKNFGDLSEESKKLLIDKGILNHKKEMDGLNKGTANIFKQNNAQITTGKYTNRANNMKRRKEGEMTIGNMSFPAAVNLGDEGNKASRVYMPTNTNLYDSVINNRAGSKLNKSEKDYLEAVIRRHEADELRASAKISRKDMANYSKGKTKNLGNIIGHSEHTAIKANTGGHVSPEVVHRESANAAIAPDKVRDSMKNLRVSEKELDDKGRYGFNKLVNRKIEPINYEKEVDKIEYGKSAVLDKKKVKRDKKELGTRINPELDGIDPLDNDKSIFKTEDLKARIKDTGLDAGLVASGGGIGYALSKLKNSKNSAKKIKEANRKRNIMAGSAGALGAGTIYNSNKE